MRANEFKGRREDKRLVSGNGRYTADVNFPGQLYAHFLRADRGHARIKSIDTSAAKAAPGVVAVFSGADLAGENFKAPGQLMSMPGRGGMQVIVPPRPLFARDKVRFVGEEVALVIADSPLAAQDAAEHIMVDYDELPVIATIDRAIAPGAALVHDMAPNNTVFDFEYGNEAATDAAIRSAEVVVTLQLDSPRVVPNCMEPRGGVVKYDAPTDSYDAYFPIQGIAMWRPGVCHVLGVAPDKVRLHSTDVGGGFGARSGAYPDQMILMWAAKRLDRPLKWTASRSEHFTTEAHGRALVLEGELALKSDGTFIAIRTNWLCDQGAYLTAAGPLTNTTNGMFTCGGAYLFEAAYGRHRVLVTNTVPTNAYRGAGRPEASYIVERLVDEAAIKVGMDRAAIRAKNAIPQSMLPYTNHGKTVYDSGNYAALVDTAVRQSDWTGFATRRAEAKTRGKLRGIGLALFLEASGGGVAPKDQGAIRFNGDGSITIHATIQNHGQGHETVFPELVGATLGIAAEDIVLSTDDAVTAALMGNGVVGSRTLQQYGSAFKLGALEVIKKGKDLAAKRLEAAADDIEFVAGTYTVKGTDRRVSLLDLAATHRGESPHPLDATAEQALARAFPSGAHVAEIEIDPATGVTKLLRYVAVDDAGVVLNHTLVEGQLQGGIAQGIGQVFGEHGTYDPATGQLLAGSFMDYFMPRAGLMPEIEIHEVLNPSPTNFLGAKGVGEAGAVGSMPTVMNAIVDALRPLGIAHFDMPATPARVWAVIASKAQARMPSAV